MRRVLALALIAFAAAVPAGCSGVDAQQAQSVLDESTTAMANVRSVSFAMRMWTSGGPDGSDFTVLMHGGGYEKGKRAGEAYVTLSSTVTNVRVDEGVLVDGEPMARITGVIDTSAALNGLLGTLGGTGAAGLGDASDVLGDIRAVLYVSETTHLPMRTLVDLPMKVGDQKIVMHMDIVLTGVNKPVAIPSVG